MYAYEIINRFGFIQSTIEVIFLGTVSVTEVNPVCITLRSLRLCGVSFIRRLRGKPPIALRGWTLLDLKPMHSLIDYFCILIIHTRR